MKDTEYAGFWIRFGATLVDTVFIIILTFPALTIIYGADFWYSEQYIQGFWDFILGYVFPVIATVWFWLRYRATPGKMATKLQVVHADTGQTITTKQAIIRYFAYFLSAIPLGLGFIWIAIDKKKQGWHDKLADTVVIRDTRKESVEFESNQ